MDLDAELRATARAHLARLLPKVLEDGHVDESEKEQLLAVFRRGILTTADVREVFSTFLKGLTGEVLADGVVTPEEQERCRIGGARAADPAVVLVAGSDRDHRRVTGRGRGRSWGPS